MNIKPKKIEHENQSYYIMMYNKTKISLAYLPKLIALTGRVLISLKECGGGIIWIKGKNVVAFENEEQTQNAIDYLNSLIIMEKLKN